MYEKKSRCLKIYCLHTYYILNALYYRQLLFAASDFLSKKQAYSQRWNAAIRQIVSSHSVTNEWDTASTELNPKN